MQGSEPPSAVAPLVLRMPANVSALESVRSELATWLEQLDATPIEAAEILISVWEACVNAIEHPIGSVTGDVMVEAAALTDGSVTVAVHDSGLWLPRRRGGAGFGMMLIDELMDDVQVASDANGTTVRIGRRLGAGHDA